MQAKRREWVLDLYNFCLGAFLLISPWLYTMTHETARLDTWFSGLLVAAVSAAAILAFREWEEWISLLAGIWMIVSPFVLGFAHTPAMHVNIGIGCAIVFLSGLELWLLHYDRPREQGTDVHRHNGTVNHAAH
ncbi:MAG: SPW repeat protein [Alphaproteobacteria bacterium]|nr:SPW repeat protein [Alphaproteobacteria bacterium]